jgi:hypothetical protein
MPVSSSLTGGHRVVYLGEVGAPVLNNEPDLKTAGYFRRYTLSWRDKTMSYSRWGSRGSGHWYTYWCVHPSNSVETKDNALFDICGVATFTAKDLRDDLDSCIAVVAKKDKEADSAKLDELKVYISEFLEDVDNEYNKEINQT